MRFNLFLLLIFLNISSFGQSFKAIENYKIAFATATNTSGAIIALRSFEDNGQQYLLIVDPQTLKTRIVMANKYNLTNLSFQEVVNHFKLTPYIKSMQVAAQMDRQLQNAGIDHAVPGEAGIALTIDLCPSHKGLDRIVFQSVFDEFKKIELPAPIAVSVSGKWMLKHHDDLDWLKGLVEKKELDITWINHSYHHEVNSLPLAKNFLLAPGTNLDAEVLENEKLMLKNGLTPSVFFRFPGLVSDQELVEEIGQYGLIPIGSDAWLAKGQHVNAGSIVLIHGNGNEELGVKDFVKLLKNNYQEVQKKQWLLFDLSAGLEQAY